MKELQSITFAPKILKFLTNLNQLHPEIISSTTELGIPQQHFTVVQDLKQRITELQAELKLPHLKYPTLKSGTVPNSCYREAAGDL